MERIVEIKPTTKEIAEMLFDLDNYQVAEVIDHWAKLFDDNYKRAREAKENIQIFDLNHFMLYVTDVLSDKGIDFFRSAYSNIIYHYNKNIVKKHLTELY